MDLRSHHLQEATSYPSLAGYIGQTVAKDSLEEPS